MNVAMSASWGGLSAFLALGRFQQGDSATQGGGQAPGRNAHGPEVIDVEVVPVREHPEAARSLTLPGKPELLAAPAVPRVERYVPARRSGRAPSLIHFKKTPGQLIDLAV